MLLIALDIWSSIDGKLIGISNPLFLDTLEISSKGSFVFLNFSTSNLSNLANNLVVCFWELFNRLANLSAFLDALYDSSWVSFILFLSFLACSLGSFKSNKSLVGEAVKEDGYVVINADDEWSMKISPGCKI